MAAAGDEVARVREAAAQAHWVNNALARTADGSRERDALMKLKERIDQEAVLRVLEVFSMDQLVGWLADVDDAWLFDYSPDWVGSENSFALSPGLPLQDTPHFDGSTERPVQWYFDNLLPEELLLRVLAKDAGLDEADSFGMLRHYGAESVGAQVLLPPGAPAAAKGLRPLSLGALSERVRKLEKEPLTQGSPKKMSLAGAQHKMVVVLEAGRLFEPLPGTPSTHILKPNSPSKDYPHSVVNEFFVMRLAKRIGLTVPDVHRLYAPEPVYIIDRFDREVLSGSAQTGDLDVRRGHVIDACQLLSAPRGIKYTSAQVPVLARTAQLCRTRALATRDIYRWLVFNTLVGNGDNHLKNISFQVDRDGVVFAPCYDMLCTAAYDTRAYAEDGAKWPQTELGISLPGANSFGEVSFDVLIEAGLQLGIRKELATRLLNEIIERLRVEASSLLDEVSAEYDRPDDSPGSAWSAPPATKAGERALLLSICKVVVRDMLGRVSKI